MKLCPLPVLNCTSVVYQDDTNGDGQISHFYRDIIRLTAEQVMAYEVYDLNGTYNKQTVIYLRCEDNRWWNASHINCTGRQIPIMFV